MLVLNGYSLLVGCPILKVNNFDNNILPELKFTNISAYVICLGKHAKRLFCYRNSDRQFALPAEIVDSLFPVLNI